MSSYRSAAALLVVALAGCGEEESCPTKAIDVVGLDGGPVTGNDFECTGYYTEDFCDLDPLSVFRRPSPCGGAVQIQIENSHYEKSTCVIFDISEADTGPEVRVYRDGGCNSTGENPPPVDGWIAFDELDTSEGGRIAARFFLQFSGEVLAGTVGGSLDTTAPSWRE